MKIELITATGALIVSVASVFFNYYKHKRDYKKWEKEKSISLHKDIYLKVIDKRYGLYAKIFQLLGEVRDIDYPFEHYKILEKDKKHLKNIADLILTELYGEAGLFMSYETRSIILKVYQNSYRYADDKIKLNVLIDSYYIARRALRKDLELDDTKSAQSSKKILDSSNNNDFLHNNIKWAKMNFLAFSARPGYPNKIVSVKVFNDTLEKWKGEGIKSIICLLSKKEINEYYESIKYNLVDFYKKKGFNAYCIYVKDFQKPPLSNDEVKKVQYEYNKMLKPVLIHCGAGEDRSGYAVEMLLSS